MKIGIVTIAPQSAKNIRYTSTPEENSTVHAPEKNISPKEVLGYLAAAGTVAAGGIIALKHGKTPQDNSVNALKFINELTTGLEIATGKKINPESLACVMNKSEFVEAVSKLGKENYIPSIENIEKGIFKADLHSHSLFSDGKAKVETILEQVCAYADKLFENTEEKFIFALTDHDTADGVKKALEIIAGNPKKFEHVRFVTGAEVSYLIKSDKTTNPYETSELLVYGFNPFSKTVENFFENVRERRLEARKDFIKDLSEKFPDVKFSEYEFHNVYLGEDTSHTPIMNSYWQLFHYGQIKKALTDFARAKNLNPEEYFGEVMAKAGKQRTLDGLKKQNLIDGGINETDEIAQINAKYRPSTASDGSIIKTSENILEDIAEAFKGEDGCSMGFAHPYYITERNSDFQGVIGDVQSKLGQMLNLTESYHQAYSPKILQDENEMLHKVSEFCEGKGLIPIGGRDNHKADFLVLEN